MQLNTGIRNAFLVLIAVLGIAGLAACSTAGGLPTATYQIAPADYHTQEAAEHESADDPGPGNCVPGADILKRLREEKPKGFDFKPASDGFTYKDNEELILEDEWVKWVNAHTDVACVKAMAKYFDVKVEDFGSWLKKHGMLRTVGEVTDGKEYTRLNTYFGKGGEVRDWKNKSYEMSTLLWFKIDKNQHLVNGDDGKPLALVKYACGNIQKKPRTIADAKKAHNDEVARSTTRTTTEEDPEDTPDETTTRTSTRTSRTSSETPTPPPPVTTTDEAVADTVACDPGPEPEPVPGHVNQLSDGGCRWIQVIDNTASTIPSTVSQDAVAIGQADQVTTCTPSATVRPTVDGSRRPHGAHRSHGTRRTHHDQTVRCVNSQVEQQPVSGTAQGASQVVSPPQMTTPPSAPAADPATGQISPLK